MQEKEPEREYIYLYVGGETNATDSSPPLISNNVYSGFGFQFVWNFTEDEARTALEEMAEDVRREVVRVVESIPQEQRSRLLQEILSSCSHVKESQTPPMSKVSNEIGIMQGTKA